MVRADQSSGHVFLQFLGCQDVASRPKVAITLNEVEDICDEEPVKLYDGDKFQIGTNNFCYESNSIPFSERINPLPSTGGRTDSPSSTCFPIPLCQSPTPTLISSDVRLPSPILVHMPVDPHSKSSLLSSSSTFSPDTPSVTPNLSTRSVSASNLLEDGGLADPEKAPSPISTLDQMETPKWPLESNSLQRQEHETEMEPHGRNELTIAQKRKRKALSREVDDLNGNKRADFNRVKRPRCDGEQ
jgi:hypothetical protein